MENAIPHVREAWNYVWGRTVPSLVITAPAAPVAAAALTIGLLHEVPATDLISDEAARSMYCVAAGVVNLLVAWAGLACLHWMLGLGTVEQANSSSYHNLRIRLDEIEARHDVHQHEDRLNPADPSHPSAATARAAHNEVHRHLKSIKHELERLSIDWVNGYGYVNIWRRIHRLEESWLCMAKPEEIRAEADRARDALSGSKIRDAKRLVTQLDAALNSLRPGTGHLHLICRATRAAEAGDHLESTTLVSARWCVRGVWRTIHEYRDSRWNGMVQARNRLMLSMGLSGLLVYGLLWLSIVGGTSAHTIYAVTAIYLAAATVGLFNRLHAASVSPVVIDDYDLAIARLTVTPQLSGLAAVLGVTIAAAASQGTPVAVDIADAFSKLPMIALALAFGLTPGLLIDRLKRWHDRTADEVQSTYPGASARSEDSSNL